MNYQNPSWYKEYIKNIQNNSSNNNNMYLFSHNMQSKPRQKQGWSVEQVNISELCISFSVTLLAFMLQLLNGLQLQNHVLMMTVSKGLKKRTDFSLHISLYVSDRIIFVRNLFQTSSHPELGDMPTL